MPCPERSRHLVDWLMRNAIRIPGVCAIVRDYAADFEGNRRHRMGDTHAVRALAGVGVGIIVSGSDDVK